MTKIEYIKAFGQFVLLFFSQFFFKNSNLKVKEAVVLLSITNSISEFTSAQIHSKLEVN